MVGPYVFLEILASRAYRELNGTLHLDASKALGAAVPDLLEQDVSASDPLRAEQAQELSDYIDAQRSDRSRLRRAFHADYRSASAFEKYAYPLRKAFAAAIGYPPPGPKPQAAARFDTLGEDSIGVYYRAFIPVVAGI